jgi:hypothetical protein
MVGTILAAEGLRESPSKATSMATSPESAPFARSPAIPPSTLPRSTVAADLTMAEQASEPWSAPESVANAG